MPWVKENADAVLVQWYAGEQQGCTLADILLGKVNPSGKLNVSFPRSTGNTPCFYNHFVTDREEPFDPHRRLLKNLKVIISLINRNLYGTLDMEKVILRLIMWIVH